MCDCAKLVVVDVANTSNLTQIDHNGYCVTSTDPAFGSLVIDGVTIDGVGVNPGVGTWVLLTGQTDTTQNGLFQVTRVANVANQINWQMCRVCPGGKLILHMLFYVKLGSVYALSLWCLDDAEENSVNVSIITAGITNLTINRTSIIGSVTDGCTDVPDYVLTFTAGAPPAPADSLTIANGAAPTGAETSEALNDISAKVNSVLACLRQLNLLQSPP